VAQRNLGSSAAPAVPSATANVVLRPLSQQDARITGGFWARRQAVNRSASLEGGYQRLRSAGNLDNLRIAAADLAGQVRGPVFMDSDVYKWLEAAAWEYGREPDPVLLERIREVSAIVASAQAADGYLASVQQVRFNGERYADLPHSHEHYCAGHLFQAAVAQVRCTPCRTLLETATRLADHLVTTFGPGRNEDVDGHPIVETGLVELFRETGRQDYLDLASWFVEARGHGSMARHGQAPTYFCDRVPVREATSVEGHAVRAVYLCTGAADVAAEAQDVDLQAALVEQWQAMTNEKMYVTGGLGARWDLEQFGDPYELPPDRAYAETCAAIGSIQWAWRMLLASGNARYADLIERTLYNAVLPGVSLGGTEYFYVNTLHCRDDAHPDDERSPALGRQGWFNVACCPPNIMRLLSSLDAYLATRSEGGVQLHQFASGTVESGEVRLAIETDFPWRGDVRVEVLASGDAPWELALRVPQWAEGATATLGEDAWDAEPGEYHRLHRSWSVGDVLVLHLPMAIRVVAPHPRMDAVRGCVAVERGPLVYCLEARDLPPDLRVEDLRIRVEDAAAARPVHREDLLEGVTTLRTRLTVLDDVVDKPYHAVVSATPAEASVSLTTVELQLVPYYAWANRAPGAMRIWFPLAGDVLEPAP
jgi:uncharacterized protein